MSSMFGHKWVSSFGEQPDPIQARALSGLTWGQMARGLALLNERGDEWPPSLPEFGKLCRNGEVEGDSRASRMPASRSLPEPDHIRHERYQRARAALINARRAAGL